MCEQARREQVSEVDRQHFTKCGEMRALQSIRDKLESAYRSLVNITLYQSHRDLMRMCDAYIIL